MQTEPPQGKDPDAALQETPPGADGEGSGLSTGELPTVSASEDLVSHQLGSRRFVYGAYLVFAVGITFIVSKFADLAWRKLAAWKPGFGEPSSELLIFASALTGVTAAVIAWRSHRTRDLVDEVAAELSKVTWPSRTEVNNSTSIVLVTTAVATVFFFLLDRFWGFMTGLVYGN